MCHVLAACLLQMHGVTWLCASSHLAAGSPAQAHRAAHNPILQPRLLVQTAHSKALCLSRTVSRTRTQQRPAAMARTRMQQQERLTTKSCASQQVLILVRKVLSTHAAYRRLLTPRHRRTWTGSSCCRTKHAARPQTAGSSRGPQGGMGAWVWWMG